MKHNPMFINGYPAPCRNDGRSYGVVDVKNNGISLAWKAVIHYICMSGKSIAYLYGHECCYCGVISPIREYGEVIKINI